MQGESTAFTQFQALVSSHSKQINIGCVPAITQIANLCS